MIRKVVLTIITLACLIFGFSMVYAQGVTLQEVADSFNKCKSITQYKEYGYNISAEVNDNKLIIKSITEDSETELEYNLEGSILSSSIPDDDDSFMGLLMTTALADSIGQIHGYEDGEMFLTLNDESIVNYTVENEGFELKEVDGGTYEIKMDIDKKVPLVDFSNVYLEKKDFQDFELNLLETSEYGSYTASKGEIRYKIERYGTFDITIYEKGELSERAYNSIITLLELDFRSNDVVDYFKENYASVKEGSKSFEGFNIIINPEDEDNKADDESVIKVIIDEEKIDSKYNVTRQEPTYDNNEETLDNEEMTYEEEENNYDIETGVTLEEAQSHSSNIKDVRKNNNTLVICGILLVTIVIIVVLIKRRK